MKIKKNDLKKKSKSIKKIKNKKDKKYIKLSHGIGFKRLKKRNPNKIDSKFTSNLNLNEKFFLFYQKDKRENLKFFRLEYFLENFSFEKVLRLRFIQLIYSILLNFFRNFTKMKKYFLQSIFFFDIFMLNLFDKIILNDIFILVIVSINLSLKFFGKKSMNLENFNNITNKNISKLNYQKAEIKMIKIINSLNLKINLLSIFDEISYFFYKNDDLNNKKLKINFEKILFKSFFSGFFYKIDSIIFGFSVFFLIFNKLKNSSFSKNLFIDNEKINILKKYEKIPNCILLDSIKTLEYYFPNLSNFENEQEIYETLLNEIKI